MATEIATLGGGCFWCTDAIFKDLIGVISVVPGYTGGHVENPTYEQVCGKMTGHAEVTQVEFDPDQLSFEDLLYVHFRTHDPTTLNRQGNDVGPQYRSAVFYHSDEQREIAERVIAETDAAKVWPNPIVTEVTEASVFYSAETFHHDYYERNPYAGYCMMVISPKVRKLRKSFADKLKE